MARETYQIDNANQLGSHLELLGYISDTKGERFVCKQGTRRLEIPVGVPLCAGCDEPVANSMLCACERSI